MTTTDDQAIRDSAAAWLTAAKSGDTKTMLSLASADVAFLQPGQEPMWGRQAFEAAHAGIRNVTVEGHVNIQQIGVRDDLAYCWTFLTMSATPENGRTHERAGDVLTVLRKENGHWLILRDANLLTDLNDSN